MLVLIHKKCGGPALEASPVGAVCTLPSGSVSVCRPSLMDSNLDT